MAYFKVLFLHLPAKIGLNQENMSLDSWYSETFGG
jgi:hypothetical protein